MDPTRAFRGRSQPPLRSASPLGHMSTCSRSVPSSALWRDLGLATHSSTTSIKRPDNQWNRRPLSRAGRQFQKPSGMRLRRSYLADGFGFGFTLGVLAGLILGRISEGIVGGLVLGLALGYMVDLLTGR
jgi:hypothetical protein